MFTVEGFYCTVITLGVRTRAGGRRRGPRAPADGGHSAGVRTRHARRAARAVAERTGERDRRVERSADGSGHIQVVDADGRRQAIRARVVCKRKAIARDHYSTVQ